MNTTHNDYAETWQTIPSIDTHEASTHGRVRLKATAEIVEPYLHRTGYIYIILTQSRDDGKAKGLPPKQVHRLVLEAHRGPCPKGFEALHCNDDPTCNYLWNLIWNTKKANGRSKRTERRKAAMRLRYEERKGLDRAAIGKLYLDGATLAQVAKAHSIGNTKTVKRILMEECIDIRPRKGRARVVDHDLIAALHIAGRTQSEIAEAVGCTKPNVGYVIRKANLPTASRTIARDRVKSLYSEGLRPFEIAKRIDCSPDSVTRILEELAEAGRVTYQKREARPATDMERIHALADAGKSNAAIVEITGYSLSTVWKAAGKAQAHHKAERNAAIVSDFKTGQHIDVIAEAYDVACSCVLKLVRTAGLKVKQGRLRA